MQIHVACQISSTECQISWYWNKLHKWALSSDVLPSFCHSQPDLGSVSQLQMRNESLCQIWHNEWHGFRFECNKVISALQSCHLAAEPLVLSVWGLAEERIYQATEKQMAQFHCCFSQLNVAHRWRRRNSPAHQLSAARRCSPVFLPSADTGHHAKAWRIGSVTLPHVSKPRTNKI